MERREERDIEEERGGEERDIEEERGGKSEI